MAHINRIVYLLLLPFVVNTLDDVCIRKLCKCSERKGKLRVDCRNKGIKEINQDEFPDNMKILDLSLNNISVIRQGFLDKYYKLEDLYLRTNEIETLEERAFVGLDGLDRLYIRENKLVKLKKEAFLGVPKLTVLDLGSNNIKNIDKHAFRGLKNLVKLTLKNNNFTTISNGTFDELTSLDRLDMKKVPLRCDCNLYSFVQYITRTKMSKALGSCSNRNKKTLGDLKGINLCEKPPDIVINPGEHQIVSIGDSLIITCQAITKRERRLYWSKNNKPLPKIKNIKVEKDFSAKRTMTFVKFSPVEMHDDGIYMCYGDDDLIPKKIAIRVVTSKSKMCSRDEMLFHYEPILWPVALKGSTIKVPCPTSYHKGIETNMRRTCTENGVWGPVNKGKCQLASFPEKLISLAKLLRKSDFNNVTQVAKQLSWLTNGSEYQSAEYVTLAFDVFAGIVRKDVPLKDEFLHYVLTSFNNMMDIDDGTLYASERKDQSPSRLGARLELISRKILNASTSTCYTLNNFVIGSLDLRDIRLKESETCQVFFKTNLHSQLCGVYCKPVRRKDYSVSVTIPQTILKDLKAVGRTVNDLKLQFLVYRNAQLFPNVISNVTESIMRNKNVSSSVLSIQMANIKELNLTDPLVIRFATQPGTEPIVTHFDLDQKVVGKQWFKSSDCSVKYSNSSTTTVECRRLVNKILAVMSHETVGHDVTVVYPVEVIVYIGAVVTSLFLIITLITFALARNLRFNRDDIIMLMNACLALLVVVLSFAFGIDRTESSFLCRAMGMSIHVFFFASLLWLGSYVVCVTRRLMPRDKDASEEVLNPVLMYYMVSWGLPAIICGMTVAGDIKNYKTAGCCWLTESAGLGAFVGPACLLFIINAFLLVRLHLLLARGIIDRHPSEENTEEERLQADEPGVLEEVPDSDERQNAEKSTITLSLVATWVVMSLIYLNFILAYFLVNSRTSKLRWISLSYLYALANIALGLVIFGFHCFSRPEVRESWRLRWKQIRAMKFTFAPYRMWKARIRKQDTTHLNGRVVLLNGQDITHRMDSDRQSNITLPSSAALTNDVFVNGRPMSTARLSLLDEVDFPPDEGPHAEAVDNEVDITEPGNSEENRRSQSSVHSERKSKTPGESVSEVSPCIPEDDEEKQKLIPLLAESPEDHADITDGGITSKSESSAPTTLEVPPATVRADSPAVEHPHIDPHLGMMRPFMVNAGRPFPPPNQALYPGPLHQFRPVFQAPYNHQAGPSHHLQPANQGVPATLQVPPRHQVPSAHQLQPTLMEPPVPPPSYQKATEIASQSSSSIGENSTSRSNFKRKRSIESLGSRNESGSAGPRTRKLQQLQPQASNSSAFSEVPSTAQVPSRPNDSTNLRNAVQNLGASNSRPANRYKDGRAKPEPKQWNGSIHRRIAYVPLPHVSKIHREPLHNETSV